MDTIICHPPLITDYVARDKVVHLLDTSPRAHQLLAQRIVNMGPAAAYAQTVRDCLPGLIAGQEWEIGYTVQRVMRARLCEPRRVRRVRRGRAA